MARRLDADFEGTPEAVSEARLFVAAALATWDLDDLSEVAQICTSEAASNAVKHARTAFHVMVRADGGEVVVRVEDHGPGQPKMRPIDPSAENGRGMWLIQSLATRWGWEPVERGKAVWFTLMGRTSARCT